MFPDLSLMQWVLVAVVVLAAAILFWPHRSSITSNPYRDVPEPPRSAGGCAGGNCPPRRPMDRERILRLQGEETRGYTGPTPRGPQGVLGGNGPVGRPYQMPPQPIYVDNSPSLIDHMLLQNMHRHTEPVVEEQHHHHHHHEAPVHHEPAVDHSPAYEAPSHDSSPSYDSGSSFDSSPSDSGGGDCGGCDCG